MLLTSWYAACLEGVEGARVHARKRCIVCAFAWKPRTSKRTKCSSCCIAHTHFSVIFSIICCLYNRTLNRLCSAMLCIARTALSSVCPCVRLSHAGILSKRLLNISSHFFHRRVATPAYSYYIPNGMAIFPREPPSTWASNAKMVWKIATFGEYLTLSRYKIEPLVLWKAKCTFEAFEWYQFQWSWVT